MTIPIALASDYQAALDQAAFIEEQQAGRIWMRGRDRAALLQRLSTNDTERLRPGKGIQTVLTTPIGRIIDLLSVYAAEDALLVVTSLGQGPAVFGYLKKNIFFNDQVTLEPAGRTLAQLALFGPASNTILTQLSGAALPELAMHAITTTQIADTEVRITRRHGLGSDAYTLFIPTEKLDSVREQLEQAAGIALSTASYEGLRIEAGIPAFGSELSQEYIPLETGLLEAVSFTKGCYVGQEIIARMESRGRLAKQLRGLRLSDPLELTLPAKLSIDNKDAGDLTSTVLSPRYGPIGLAYVRSAHCEPGTQVGIMGSSVVGEVVELPF